MTMKKSLRRGFTLVELMIVVAIIGVLAALAIYGVRRYVYTAKTAESKEGVGRIAKDASSSYNAERMPGTVLSLGSTAAGANQFCSNDLTGVIGAPAAGSTIPGDGGDIAGRKYQSSPVEWDTDPAFNCLGFSMQDPQYYAYGFAANCSGQQYSAQGVTVNACDAVGNSFEAFALGDLDGDGTYSTYQMRGAIQTDANGGLILTVAPNFESTDDLE